MYPIIILSITGVITLFLGFDLSKKNIFLATESFLLLALVSLFFEWNENALYFYEMVLVDRSNTIFGIIILLSAFLIVGLSENYFDEEMSHNAEYYALIQFALVGALMLVFYNHLIMLFLGVEILSISLYVLTGSEKRNLRGNEAALKYFLMGAFATGFFLFGIAMYYGGTGTFKLTDGSFLYQNDPSFKVFLIIGILFILVGMLFKVSTAPFHFWAPDVYEGAPTIFTAFMSVIVKIAGFYALYKLINSSFSDWQSIWKNLLIGSALLSLFIGNILAIAQNNFKRLMAFSGISHAGFMLLSLITTKISSNESLALYTLAYSFASIIAFGIFINLSKNEISDGRKNESLDLFSGLRFKDPILTAFLCIAMLSFAGIPLTAGFWGKFMVLNDAEFSGKPWIIVFALFMSAVSLYYYFIPIKLAFAKSKAQGTTLMLNPIAKFVLTFCSLGLLFFGVFPDQIIALF